MIHKLFPGDGFGFERGYQFMTYDNDSGGIAATYASGWWFSTSSPYTKANLNGQYNVTGVNGITYKMLTGSYTTPLKSSLMMMYQK